MTGTGIFCPGGDSSVNMVAFGIFPVTAIGLGYPGSGYGCGGRAFAGCGWLTVWLLLVVRGRLR
jgi:hypothetical protein